MGRMLEDKVAVIYGASGAVGSSVSRAFAREGARLFLTGIPASSVDALAKEIVSAGGSAQAAEVNALDERAIDEHLRSVVDTTGRIDISFNAVGLRNTKLQAFLSWSSTWRSLHAPSRRTPSRIS